MASETNVQPENFVRDRVRIHHLGPSPVTLDRDNSDLQVVNTTTETALLEYTVQGGQLVGDRGLRVTLNGYQANHSGGSFLTTLRVKLGATTLWELDINLTDPDPDPAGNVPVRMVLELMAKNSDAEQELFFQLSRGSEVPPTTGEGSMGGGTYEMYGTSTEDATGDLVLAVTVEMDTADPDAEFTRRRWIIELL